MITTVIAAAALLAANAQQFDLVCTGTVESSRPAGNRVTEPYETRFRIDLNRDMWCQDECATTRPFATVNNSEFVLVRDPKEEGIGITKRIDRTTGTYYALMTIRSRTTSQYINYRAQCTKAEYTPIPSQQF